MGHTNDVPPEIRGFHKLFDSAAGYSYDSSRLFDHLLDYIIEYFNPIPDLKQRERLRDQYTGKDENLLHRLMVELFQNHAQAIESRAKASGTDYVWFDPFGEYYMYLASRSKQSRMGQFFTPAEVCDMMAMLTVAPKEDGSLVTINDPACGSGRTLLAAYMHLRGNAVLYGEDLDEMCAKMSAINMLLHGCKSRIICMNSLSRGDRRGAWIIQTPQIIRISTDGIN